MKKIYLFLACIFILMTGCNNTDDFVLSPEHVDDQRSSYGINRRSGEFTDDITGGLDLGDASPGLVGIAGTDTRGNYTNDVDRARQVIAQIGGYNPGQVLLDGNHMAVTAHYNGQLTPRQRAEAEEDVRSHLHAAFPNYTMKVNVRDSR